MKTKTTLLFLFITTLIYAQVGIGTTDPKNTLHINGGVRIDNIPDGIDEDAQIRLLATNEEGDIVQVENTMPEDITIPQLAFNAQFGGSTNATNGFFPDCIDCPNNSFLRLNLNDEVIRVNSQVVTLVDPDTTQPSDEFFRINESGVYRFEVNLVATISQNRRWLINFRLFILKADGTFETDSIRAYAGKPVAENGNTQGAQIGQPIYITDSRNYDAGDIVLQFVEVVRSGDNNNEGTGDIESVIVTNATYKGQITITQY